MKKFIAVAGIVAVTASAALAGTASADTPDGSLDYNTNSAPNAANVNANPLNQSASAGIKGNGVFISGNHLNTAGVYPPVAGTWTDQTGPEVEPGTRAALIGH